MGKINKTIPISSVRECGTCTKCCEGWLKGEIYGNKMMPGLPCHFKKETSCAIYENRPQHPCKDFVCEWLVDLSIPEWMKPNISNVIIKKDLINNINYLNVVEAGSKLQSEVLNWAFASLVMGKYKNIKFTINGGTHYYGTDEFNNAMNELNDDYRQKNIN